MQTSPVWQSASLRQEVWPEETHAPAVQTCPEGQSADTTQLPAASSLQAVVGPWNSFGLDPFSTGLGASSGQFGFSLDALLESRVWVDGSAADLAWNGGAGVAWVPGGFDVLGLAIVGGFEINMEFIPVDLVLEYRPHIWLAPWPGDFGAVNTYIDFVGFSAHLRVYPFPAGKRD